MSVVLVGARGLRAIAADERTTLVLNVRDSSTLPGLDADAVVAVPCLAQRRRLMPPALRTPAAAVEAAERATIQAIRSGSRRAGVKALAIDPG